MQAKMKRDIISAPRLNCTPSVLAHAISAGELADIQHMLPKELNELWPPAA